MSLFITDLDNTLIYSYKREIGENKILVEQKDGKELSFMTQESISLLQEIQQKYEIIPLTTRSLAQYQRIQLPENISPQYALAANGGILLVDGKMDEHWYAESKTLSKKAEAQLQKGKDFLENDEQVYLDVIYVDEIFMYTKSHQPDMTLAGLKHHLNLNLVSIHKNGEKIYILPMAIHKGKALKRIKRLFPRELIVSAGDSIFDIPMLFAADIGFYPKDLDKIIQLRSYQLLKDPSKQLIMVENSIFSDGFLKILNAL